MSVKFPADADAVSSGSTFWKPLLWTRKKTRLPTLDLFCWVKKIREQSEAPKCLFLAMESTQQTGPKTHFCSSFSISSGPTLAHLWAPWLCTRGSVGTVDSGPRGWPALTWVMSGLACAWSQACQVRKEPEDSWRLKVTERSTGIVICGQLLCHPFSQSCHVTSRPQSSWKT